MAEYEVQWKSWRDQLLQNRNRQTQHISPELLNPVLPQASYIASQHLYPTTQAFVPELTTQANTQYHYAEAYHPSDGTPTNYTNHHLAHLVDKSEPKSDQSLISVRKQPINYTLAQTEQPTGFSNEPFHTPAPPFRDHVPRPGSYNSSRETLHVKEDYSYFRNSGYGYSSENEHFHATSRWRHNDLSRRSYSEQRYGEEPENYIDNSAPRPPNQYPYFEEPVSSHNEHYSEVGAQDASQLFKRRALQGKNLLPSLEKKHHSDLGRETARTRSRIEERLAMHAGTKLQETPTFQPDSSRPDEPHSLDEVHPFPKRSYEPKVIEYHHRPGRVKSVEPFCLDYSHGKKRARSPTVDISEKTLVRESQDNTSVVPEEAKAQVQDTSSQPAQLFPSAAVIEEQSRSLVLSRVESEDTKDAAEGKAIQSSPTILLAIWTLGIIGCLQDYSTSVVPESKGEPLHPTETETVMVEDLLLPPGRFGRPGKIVIILRGPPGSGKSHLARLIKVH